MLNSGPRGKLMRFSYDVPDLITEGTAPQVFKECRRRPTPPPGMGGPADRPRSTRVDAPRFEVDAAMRKEAEDVHGVPPKNTRGDLPALLVTPLTDTSFPNLELPLTLAMTRSLGDFYMHTFGVTWKPEVISIDLGTFMPAPTAAGGPRKRAGTLRHRTLILASDGIWDLYENDEAFRAIVEPPTRVGQSTRAASAFYDACITRGADLLGSSADNLTGIVVYLNPAGTPALEPGTKPHAAASPPLPMKPPPPSQRSFTAAVGSATATPPPPPPVAFDDDDDCGC